MQMLGVHDFVGHVDSAMDTQGTLDPVDSIVGETHTMVATQAGHAHQVGANLFLAFI